MCCVESKHENLAQQRLKLLGGCKDNTISVMNECEATFAHLFFESRCQFAQRGRVHLIKGPAGSAQLVNRTEKTIGLSSDRFCNEHRFVIAAVAGELFGGDAEEKTEMLAQRHLQVTAAKQ